MVLGAGLGTRLRPFTELVPKPLLPILGVPCIEFALTQLQANGFKKAVINSHAHADQLDQYVESQPVAGLELAISSERAKLLGSAGGFRHALPQLGKHAFLGINADVISLVSIPDLVKRHEALRKERKVSMTLALLSGEWLLSQSDKYRKIDVNESTGIVQGCSDKLLQHTPYYCGVGIFEPEAFEHLPDGESAEFVPQVLEPLIKKKKVGFMYTDSLWMDIGRPELWFRAHFDLYQRFLNQALPEFWSDRIKAQIGTCKISLKDKNVDYLPLQPSQGPNQAASPLGKNSIRLQNIIHAIPNLGNL